MVFDVEDDVYLYVGGGVILFIAVAELFTPRIGNCVQGSCTRACGLLTIAVIAALLIGYRVLSKDNDDLIQDTPPPSGVAEDGVLDKAEAVFKLVHG